MLLYWRRGREAYCVTMRRSVHGAIHGATTRLYSIDILCKLCQWLLVDNTNNINAAIDVSKILQGHVRPKLESIPLSMNFVYHPIIEKLMSKIGSDPHDMKEYK